MKGLLEGINRRDLARGLVPRMTDKALLRKVNCYCLPTCIVG